MENGLQITFLMTECATLGKRLLKSDNGFYTRGFIFDKLLDFITDNGSTGSILSSRKYNELKTDLEPFERPFNTTVYDASCRDENFIAILVNN